jgi:sulfite reductase beta subunit-like hemoprotein
VAGVDHDELYDTSGIIRELTDFLAGNPDYSGLPRKLKITITGCALLCVYPEINDIGIFAVPGLDGGPVFRVRVGGGLSTSPRFAGDLGVIIRPSEVVEVCAGIAGLLRERAQGHDNRGRPSFMVAESELNDFRGSLEAILGRSLERADEIGPALPAHKDRSHVGIHRQHTDGLFYVGLSFVGGRTSSSDLQRLAHLALEYGISRFRTTNTQNIMMLDVTEPNLEPLTRELKLAGFDYEPGWASKGLLACTGIQFCKLALTETKNRAAQLGRELESKLALDEPVRISVTGCPNSCGQHHICDVGLEGSLTTIDGVKQEAFQVFLGGGVGSEESFGRRVGNRIPADRLLDSLASLFASYKALRARRESFQDFCRRHSDRALEAFLHAQDLTSQALQVTPNRLEGYRRQNRLGRSE